MGGRKRRSRPRLRRAMDGLATSRSTLSTGVRAVSSFDNHRCSVDGTWLGAKDRPSRRINDDCLYVPSRLIHRSDPMKVTALALVPPLSAIDCPRVTPELLASSLARYSRSNRGIDA